MESKTRPGARVQLRQYYRKAFDSRDTDEELNESLKPASSFVSFDDSIKPAFGMSTEDWMPVVAFLDVIIATNIGQKIKRHGIAVEIEHHEGPDSMATLATALHATDGLSFPIDGDMWDLSEKATKQLARRRQMSHNTHGCIRLIVDDSDRLDGETGHWYDDLGVDPPKQIPHINCHLFAPTVIDLLSCCDEDAALYDLELDNCIVVVGSTGKVDELFGTCWFALHPAVRSLRRRDGTKGVADMRQMAIRQMQTFHLLLRERMTQADSNLAGGRSRHSPCCNLSLQILSMMHTIGWKNKKRKLEL
jgi:hypothetical protein